MMISVIIPTYNRGLLIQRAIDSVLLQSYQDIEIIVVDDCSTDDTKDVVASYKNNEKVRYFCLPKNGGACKARNVGIDHARGSIIAFLDSDDEWSSQKLEIQYRFLQEKQADIVVCNYEYERNGKAKLAIHQDMQNISYEQLLYANCITTGAIMVKKSVFDTVGKFDEKMPRYQDWELVLRISQKYQIYYLSQPLLTLHFQKNSISNSTSMEKKYFALERIYQKNEKEILQNKNAYAHICWSMGLYSLFGSHPRLDLMKKGVYESGFRFKRFMIFLFTKYGFKNVVIHFYAKKH